MSDVQQTDSSLFKNLEFGLPTKWIPFARMSNEEKAAFDKLRLPSVLWTHSNLKVKTD